MVSTFLVPGSGGKDSGMIAHILKYKYKMNPLYVTWSPLLYTEVGINNLQNLYSSESMEKCYTKQRYPKKNFITWPYIHR